jgi:serine/threonine protein kinase
MAATPISSPNSTELVAAFELKKHLTKWLKIKDLGKGSFGKVWLEQETSSKQLRAIKAVWRGSQIDYLREIRALAALTKVDTAAMRWSAG